MAYSQLQELQQIEMLCRQMYESTNTDERNKAEQTMLEFSANPDNLSKCRLIMEESKLCYAQLFAAQSIMKIVTKHAANFSVDQKVEIRDYIINYLATRKNLESFVVQALAKLWSKILKILWFEVTETQRVMSVMTKLFFDVDIDRQITGVLVLTYLVEEINQPDSDSIGHRSLTRQRRISSTFRDSCLFDIFSFACSTLHKASSVLANDRSYPFVMLAQANLKLALSCLTYDFIGTTTDETNMDDMPTVQVPTSWRRLFIEPSTLDLFFSLYHTLMPELSGLAIMCLVQITSIRRSLLSCVERQTFLNRIVAGIISISENPGGLSNPDVFHEFCRLLLRFKANFQLTELVKVPEYGELLRIIKDFTVRSFDIWTTAPNSVHYLLMLWQKLVSSATYTKGVSEHCLDKLAPEVFKAYVDHRLNNVKEIVTEGLDDPLEDFPMVQQQMEQLSYIGRQSFYTNIQYLRNLFDVTTEQYKMAINNQASSSNLDLAILEGRLSWLIHISSASISGRLFIKVEDESYEGDLTCRIMQFIHFSDTHLRKVRRCEKLELAFLHFFDIYRKCFISDQSQYGCRMQKKLTETMGLSSESTILSMYITKIVTNLNYWADNDLIVKDTLLILNELSVGFSSMTKIADLEEVKFLINHHTPEHFPFLGTNTSIEFMKYRTTFYTSLARLLLENMRAGNDELFDDFMLPIDKSFNQLRQAIVVNPNPSLAQNQDAKNAFIGLCRDVRGLAKEFVKPPSYVFLFEWIYPAYTQVIKNALELWYNDPNVTSPALKLVAELVDNREKRTYYEGATPEAIYLFREISSILIGFGTRILTITDIPPTKIYQYKLKSIAISFRILQISLRGKMNFAIFQLYGDTVLSDLLQMFVKLFLATIHCDILSYPKLSSQYYPLLEILSANHFDFLINLDQQILGYILESVKAGIAAMDDKLMPSCLLFSNNILSQLFKCLTKVPRKIRTSTSAADEESKRQACLKVVETHSPIFHAIMAIILDLIMSTESTNHPQMQQPFLCLILLYEDKFNQLKQNVISSYPPDKQASVSSWFDSLMDGISRNLSQGNKER